MHTLFTMAKINYSGKDFRKTNDKLAKLKAFVDLIDCHVS